MKSLNKFNRKTINKLLKGISKRDIEIEKHIDDYNKLNRKRNRLIDNYNELAERNKRLRKELKRRKVGFVSL